MGPDVHVFVSYARHDANRVEQLAMDLGRVADRVWFDSHVTGGQQWWNVILDQIASCSLFVLAVSRESLRSEWCRVEAEWARDLDRPILPVRIDNVDIALAPRWLRDRQILPLTERTLDGMLAVVEAINQLTREPVLLPDPMVGRPGMPAGPLDDERERLGRHELTPTDQSKLMAVLRDALNHRDQRNEATELIRTLAARSDVTKSVHDACTAILGAIAASATRSTVMPGTEAVAKVPMVSLIEGRTARTLKGHRGDVNGCAVAPDGTYIVSTSDDGTLRLWDPATGDTIRTLQGHTDLALRCAVAPDGTYIVSTSYDRTLRLWDPTTGHTIRTLQGHTDLALGCAVAPDGTYIVSTSAEGTLRLWDPTTGDTIRTLHGHSRDVNGCAVAPDGTYIASTSDDDTLRLWDPATGDTIRTLTGHTGSVSGCAVAPDGTYIASASHDGTLRLWDPATGDTIRTLHGHTGPVFGCAVAPDGTYIASASHDGTLRLWDPATGDTIRTLHGHTGPVFGCAVAPDGTYIASASDDKTLRIWR